MLKRAGERIQTYVEGGMMRKIEFGSGAHKLLGWENYDTDVDISKPLPFADSTVDYILAEHVIEHVTPAEGYSFLKECERILKTGGVARISVPSIEHLMLHWSPLYAKAVQEGHRVGNGDYQSSIEGLIYGHEHKTIYTESLLATLMRLAGFWNVVKTFPNESSHKELNGVDMCGDNWVKRAETIVLEGEKR